MGFFDGLGDIIAGAVQLPTIRQPTRIVTTMGFPGGSYVFLSNGFSGPVTLATGDEWVVEIETMSQQIIPSWWEVGMNLRNNAYYGTFDPDPNYDGFSYLNTKLYVNDEEMASGLSVINETLYVPAEATARIVVSGEFIPDMKWADFTPTGYAVKAIV